MLRPILLLTTCALTLFTSCQDKAHSETRSMPAEVIVPKKPDTEIDFEADYDRRMQALLETDSLGRWKDVRGPYPLKGAVLPYKRVIAFYGNLFSKRMGILGELPKQQMLDKLREENLRWAKADSTIPTIPALHYVAITAQGKPGKQNMYRQRMPHKQIDTIISWARSIDGIAFLDIQIGHSTLPQEVSSLSKFLKNPDVHLGIDPEFAMKDGIVPGRKIGTLSAAEINTVIDTLQRIVKENNLPPKILVIHRFTQGMVTESQNIKVCPEVQVVMHMDGWGGKALKRSSYRMAVYREPVQFAGFKLFYKHDTRSGGMMSPDEILRLTPKPVYIQYQ